MNRNIACRLFWQLRLTPKSPVSPGTGEWRYLRSILLFGKNTWPSKESEAWKFHALYGNLNPRKQVIFLIFQVAENCALLATASFFRSWMGQELNIQTCLRLVRVIQFSSFRIWLPFAIIEKKEKKLLQHPIREEEGGNIYEQCRRMMFYNFYCTPIASTPHDDAFSHTTSFNFYSRRFQVEVGTFGNIWEKCF